MKTRIKLLGLVVFLAISARGIGQVLDLTPQSPWGPTPSSLNYLNLTQEDDGLDYHLRYRPMVEQFQFDTQTFQDVRGLERDLRELSPYYLSPAPNYQAPSYPTYPLPPAVNSPAVNQFYFQAPSQPATRPASRFDDYQRYFPGFIQ